MEIDLDKLIKEKTDELIKLLQQNNELVRQIQQLQLRTNELGQKCLKLDGAISQLKALKEKENKKEEK